MADPQTVFVQSISSAGGKAVVGTVIAGSAVVQWVIPTDALGQIPANVRSYPAGAGLLVVPINTNGDPIHFPALADHRSAVSAVITDSADHVLLAGLSGKRFYASALTLSVQSVGGPVSLKDSSGPLWTVDMPPQDTRHFALPVPLRSTLASSLTIACQNSGAGLIASLAGFDA